MPNMIVSEKTLELNVGAELLFLIRAVKGSEAAFWIGMRQDQEAKNGIDELIQNVPKGVHLALQFKAPRPTPRNGPFRFAINDRPHSNLLRLARQRPSAVHYVLPHYNTFAGMRASAGKKPLRLLTQTYFLPVSTVDPLPAATNAPGRHTLESTPPSAAIRSQPLGIRLISPNIFQELAASFVDQQLLIGHEQLRDWLRALLEQEHGDRRRIGQRLRGFSTFCMAGS